MTGILDQVARRSSLAVYNQFQPASPHEFFALQLARRLNDALAAPHYVELLEHYSEAQALAAYRRAKTNGSRSDPARSFHVELERVGESNGNGRSTRTLAAIRVERRAVAVAIFSGEDLKYPPLVRQLPSDSDKALSSIARFISRIYQKCPFKTAALEEVPDNAEAQRTLLTQIILRVLAEQAVGIWEVSKQDILAAFAQPPLRFRKQARDVISKIWPDMNGSFGAQLIKDALALGLYCQVEYLFNL